MTPYDAVMVRLREWLRFADVADPQRGASERRLGEFRRRPTLMFNGYGDQVASLYSGMDLKKNY